MIARLVDTVQAVLAPASPVAIPRAEHALVSSRITLAMLGADDRPTDAAIDAAGDAVAQLSAAYGGGMATMPVAVRGLYDQLCQVHAELRRLRAGVAALAPPLLGSEELR